MCPQLATYDRIVHLGEGGMGTVWLARDPAGELVALKTLKAEHAKDARVRAMFLKEMRLASAIRHPNVVSVLGTGDEGDAPFFVMEYVHGRSVRELLPLATERGGMPVAVALRIALDACAGLHAAHEARSPVGMPLDLVHRDVTPHNLLVATSGVTKVIDFGVAKARELAGGDTTSSGGVKGKVRYMAPEQALARRLDRRADVFALGAVLYELVVGRPPFEGPNDLAILRTLLASQRVDVPASLPPVIGDILQRALARRPDDRFPNAAELASAIGGAMSALRLVVTHDDVAAYVASIDPALAHDSNVAMTIGTSTTPDVEAATLTRTRRVWLTMAISALVVLGTAASSVASVSASPPSVGAPPVAAVAVDRVDDVRDEPASAAPVPAAAHTPSVPAPAVPKAAAPSTRPVRPSAPPRRPALVRPPSRTQERGDDLATALRERR